ncbi:MAG: hypothetical protein KF787_02360 [Phycisphaeraceae bacterium]|nr:hypothetical protein [Phycisphaerae bacterium]MBX3391468.1 hypothetical protein [Phycisphaeraceae bacterium]
MTVQLVSLRQEHPPSGAGTPALARRAFSMIEATVCVVLVGILLAGSLAAAGNSARDRLRTSESALAAALALDLAEEIAGKGYGSTSGGTIPTTTHTGPRATLATIDQYNGLAESPPKDPSGMTIPRTTGWTRSTAVTRVVADDPGVPTTLESGVKRVTITISRGSSTRWTCQFVRSWAWDNARN